MLIKLPIEIFQHIGSYLSTTEITICQTVCKNWYKKWIIFSYYSVQTKGKNQFRNLFDHALKGSLYPSRTDYSIGYQIRKLIIENGHIEPAVLGQLPLLCPYLEVLMFDGVVLSEEARREPFQYYQQRKNREELSKIQHNFAHWTNMRQIVELNGITVAHSLLCNTQQLTHVSVQFNNSNDRTNSKSSFIDLLVNAPLLESLSIERVYLTVNELEKIHVSCPKLSSFRLVNAVLLPMPEDFSLVLQDIMPANYLYDLKIIDGSFCDDVTQWLEYISRKYIFARSLDIGNCSYSSEENNNSIDSSEHKYQNQLLQIAKKLNKLEALKILSFNLGNQFFNILDKKGTFLSDLTLGDGLNATILFEELNALIKSKQRYYISKLTIHGWPLFNGLQGTLLMMETLNQCSNLTFIHLSMGRYLQNDNSNLANSLNNNSLIDNGTLYLDFILEICPKLTSLTITNAKLITTGDEGSSMPFFNSYKTFFPLQSFTLENVLFKNTSIFDIISSKCPLLDHLSLNSTVPNPEHTSARHLDIYLPHHKLKSLVLDRIRVSRKCSIRLGTSRFKIITGKRTVWYDLVGYECTASHFSFVNHKNNTGLVLSEKMRARKFKAIHDAEIALEYNLDQSVYAAVICKDVESVCLTGLQVI